MTNCLCMPSTYVEVKDDEVEYQEGGWNWWNFWKVAAISSAIIAGVTFFGVLIATALPGILAGCGVGYSLAVGALCGIDAVIASCNLCNLAAVLTSAICAALDL